MGQLLPSIQPYRIYPMGDCALVVEFGESVAPEILGKVQGFSQQLARHPYPGLVEQVPAFTTVTVYFDPGKVKFQRGSSPYQAVQLAVEQLLQNMRASSVVPAADLKEIPVCYGGAFGPDLAFVAQTNHLSEEEVIALHAGGEYLVYMIGFAPGFPYLGGLDTRIASPRKATPRAAIPAGSVGIAGVQTGVYPLETPGGWQLIGRTPVALFRPKSASVSLLKAGDKVRFYPITEQQYDAWGKEDES